MITNTYWLLSYKKEYFAKKTQKRRFCIAILDFFALYLYPELNSKQQSYVSTVQIQ